MSVRRLSAPADVPLESVVLLVGGLTMLLLGVLLVPVGAGALAYTEDGWVGLLLVVLAFQAITLGRTPVGDVRPTWPLVGAAAAVASVGMVTCFVPGLLGPTGRVLLVACLGLGGIVPLVRGFADPSRFRLWWRLGGPLRPLAAACTAVYAGGVLAAWLLGSEPVALPLAVAASLGFGAALVALAGVLRDVDRRYPGSAAQPGTGPLSTAQAVVLLTAVFLLLLGVLLVPVNLGAIPFAQSAQVGLLMVVLALRVLATGDTPLGVLPRSWPLLLGGLAFAGLGVVACVTPGILTWPLALATAVFSMADGAGTLVRLGWSAHLRAPGPRAPRPAVLRRMDAARLALGVLGILFGASVLLAGLLPGPLLGVVLAGNGLVLLYLVRLLVLLDRRAA